MKVSHSGHNDKEHIFECLFKEKYRPLFYYALNILKSAEEAEDVVGECFEHGWEHWEEMQQASIGAFMYRYVRNACIDRLRHFSVEQAYKKVIVLDAFDYIHLPDEPNERMQRVWQVIDSMPPQMRKAFTAVFFDKKSYKEAGEDLGVSVNTIKTHVRKALKILRDHHFIVIIFI